MRESKIIPSRNNNLVYFPNKRSKYLEQTVKIMVRFEPTFFWDNWVYIKLNCFYFEFSVEADYINIKFCKKMNN